MNAPPAVADAELPDPSSSKEPQEQGGLRGGVGEDPLVPFHPSRPKISIL